MHPNHTTRRHQGKFSQEQEIEICRRYQLPKDNGDMPSALSLLMSSVAATVLLEA